MYPRKEGPDTHGVGCGEALLFLSVWGATSPTAVTSHPPGLLSIFFFFKSELMAMEGLEGLGETEKTRSNKMIMEGRGTQRSRGEKLFIGKKRLDLGLFRNRVWQAHNSFNSAGAPHCQENQI